VEQKAYTVVGIMEQEFFGTGGADTADAVLNAVVRAFRSSMANARGIVAKGVPVSKRDMVVLIRDSFSEGKIPGFEEYTTVLLINRPALDACRSAGVQLKVLGELDEGEVPQPVGRWVALPLYFE
jgi:hypothetical protein